LRKQRCREHDGDESDCHVMRMHHGLQEQHSKVHGFNGSKVQAGSGPSNILA
jgi:hypothetical protein